MDNQARLSKLKTAITLFTIFKFVGLALLILGGILFAIDMVEYCKNLLDAMNAGNDDALVNAFVTFIFEGSASMFLLMLGIAALIVFSILGKKKKAAKVSLENQIRNENANHE